MATLLIFLFSSLNFLAAAPLDVPICKVAREKAVYTETVKIPKALQTDIANYKKAWVGFCDRKPDTSLHKLWGMAESLKKKFYPIVSSAAEAIPSEQVDAKKAAAFNDVFNKDLPRFIPAFEGGLIEVNFFAANIEEFEKLAQHGTAEDKRFFALYANLKSEDWYYPWWEWQFDGGGCIKFGEYNWIKAFEAFKQAKALKATPFRDFMREMEKDLITTLTDVVHEESTVRTCKKQEAVLADLDKLVPYLKKEKAKATLAAKLEETQQGIKAEKIKIYSFEADAKSSQ